MIHLRIDDHLIIPFGRPKWDISKIRLCGVSTQATYFESDTPCVYINKAQGEPIRFEDFNETFPEPDRFPRIENSFEAFHFMCDYMKADCHLQTESEKLFLDLYAKYCKAEVTPFPWSDRPRHELPAPETGDYWVFGALIPLPQAHLYLEDPLNTTHSFRPETMVKVDFAFWTGKQIVAVEIDGESHIGNELHVKKDTLLMRAGVTTIHILNSELRTYDTKVVSELLPRSVTQFWNNAWNRPYGPSNPLSEMPF